MLERNRPMTRGALPRRTALVMAIALGVGMAGMAYGQATTGSIFGKAPQQSGETVMVKSASGVTREVSVSGGQFSVNDLPVGSYTVTLKQNGQAVRTRNNVTITVGAGTNVDFTAAAAGTAANAQNLSAIQVSANALPAIDVSNVNSQTVITAQQLQALPIAHNATAIALLAPGAVRGSGYFTGPSGNNLVSFGGSSVTENAYYINGFNTTDPLSGFGGMTLPYGSIAQQQMLTGGYGAKYGRSDGGVISQVGKRGTNEWHFGGQVRWLPEFLQAGPRNQYHPGGTINEYNNEDTQWEAQYSAYIGGPLVKDKLFLFASAMFTRREGSSVDDVTTPYKTQWQRQEPDYYLKLDWNINENNILEFTGVRNTRSYAGQLYDFDYDTFTEGAFHSYDTHTKDTDELWVAKYTSYITDNLTLTAMYGKLHHTYFTATPGYDPTTIYLGHPERQNPAIVGNHPRLNSQVLPSVIDPRHKALNTNLRIDLTWHIGDHTLTAGIDNQQVYDYHDGSTTSGPGYSWNYNMTPSNDPDLWIIGGPVANGADWRNQLWVEAPGAYPGGGTGYYVTKGVSIREQSVSTSQRAQYIQDDWRVTDRWRVRIGLRNDQFVNYNSHGQAYVRLTKPQWSPRLGFTWDVYGDSSFKVYGNAGRYYLALPAGTALRITGGSFTGSTYYTYTGIGPDGIPTGLTPINTSRGPGQFISVNDEYGQARDPRTNTSINMKAEDQDEFILGFDKKLGDAWVYGAKATYRKLRNGIDDVGDKYAIARKMVAMGLVTQAESQSLLAGGYIPATVMFNPNKTNVFRFVNPDGGYYLIPMSMDDFGFNTTMKRSYWGLDMYLEHPFDGRWFGKITYTLSHSYGNSEGQVRSDIGQDDISLTEDWDYAQIMDYANGDLPNDRRHQIKAYGIFQVTPEWTVSGNLTVMSGVPRVCLGAYGPDRTNPGLGYGGSYHFCEGKPYPPGTNHNPWEYHLDLGVQYRPLWAGHKLAFAMNVQNVLNRQSVRQTYASYDGGNPYWPSLEEGPMPIYWTAPRTVSFSISYDY